jgi:hypothetical protein
MRGCRLWLTSYLPLLFFSRHLISSFSFLLCISFRALSPSFFRRLMSRWVLVPNLFLSETSLWLTFDWHRQRVECAMSLGG